jgi:preprotein translocase subunit YajC
VVLLLIFPLIVVFWFMIIRPQQQRLRAQQALVQALEVGDEVVTTAGIYATITALDVDVVTLEIAPGVEIRSARAAIGRRVTAVVAADDAPASDHSDDEGADDQALGGAA